MSFVQRTAKIVFAMLVMVALLWSATLSVSHVEGMAGNGDLVVAMDQACCPDHGDDGHQGKKDMPHDCCMAHCLSMRPSLSDTVAIRVERSSLPVQFVYKGDVVPNQFLKGLFRPPRTLA